MGWLAGIAWKELAGNMLGGAWSGVKGAGKWLGSLDLVHLCLLAAALFGAWQTVGRWSQHRHTVKVEGQLSKCSAARDADAKRYADAQVAAVAANEMQIARVKASQDRITANVDNSYQADLARLRAELSKRLPAQARPAPSDPGSAKAPDVPAAPDGPDGESRVSIPSSLYVRGAELELQLERLQQWVSSQMKVDPNQ